MAHLSPVILPGGSSLYGSSLGFHAYSLRLDNLTNQWLQEESSLAWIPPYSLGVCLRLYGTGVALLLCQAPAGQPQLAPIAGEYAVGFYSDELRSEMAGVPVRQFTAVQSVSDLTQGPQPAFPPPGVTRMYAAADGTIHYVLPSGVDRTEIDTGNLAANVATQPLGGDLSGTVNNGHVALAYGGFIRAYDSGGTLRNFMTSLNTEMWIQNALGGLIRFINQAGNTELGYFDNAGNFRADGSLNTQGALLVGGAGSVSGGMTAPTYFMGAGATWPLIQAAGASIRYAAATGGVHSFELQGGGYAVITSGNAVVNGTITSNTHNINSGSISIDASQRLWMGGNGANPSLRSDGVNQIMNIGASGQLLVKNFAETAWMPITALAFNVGSSLKIKHNLETIQQPVATILDPTLHGWTYDDVLNEPRIGFIADHWYKVKPELVHLDENGEPESMDYAAVGAITFEALKNYIVQTNLRLDKLEGAA